MLVQAQDCSDVHGWSDRVEQEHGRLQGGKLARFVGQYWELRINPQGRRSLMIQLSEIEAVLPSRIQSIKSQLAFLQVRCGSKEVQEGLVAVQFACKRFKPNRLLDVGKTCFQFPSQVPPTDSGLFQFRKTVKRRGKAAVELDCLFEVLLSFLYPFVYQMPITPILLHLSP